MKKARRICSLWAFCQRNRLCLLATAQKTEAEQGSADHGVGAGFRNHGVLDQGLDAGDAAVDEGRNQAKGDY